MRRRERDAEYAEFFSARGAALRRTAYGLCGDWGAAEELTQAAFVKLYAKWGNVRAESAEAYTRRIILNLFLNGRRKWGREYITAEPYSSATTQIAADDRLDLSTALAKLPTRQRAIVVLRFLDDLPVAEVAGMMDIAEGTVKSQTSRALASLRSMLEPAPNPEGLSHG